MFSPLGHLLNSSIRRARIESQVEATLAMDHFREAAQNIWGKAILQNVKPIYLKNRCLTVAVLSHLYAQEIRLRELEILKEINKKMRKDVVDRIRCLV